MNKNSLKRQRNENLLKSRFPSGGDPEARKKSQIRIAKELEKTVRSRCCYVRPKQIDFGQITERLANNCSDAYNSVPSIKQHSYIATEQSGVDAVIHNKKIIQEFENIFHGIPKAHNCSQYNKDTTKFVTNFSNTAWQNIDSVEDIEEFLHETSREVSNKHSVDTSLQNVHISEDPKIKIIAEKFSKFKRNNMELRRLDERVVCLEYDVFNQESSKTIQKMRAFFSVKPGYKNDAEELQNGFPLKVKQEFKILDKDLSNLTEKEIEIIDENIEGNKTYLEDLRRILKQKQLIDGKKHKSSLDLKSLYELAKRANSCLNCDLSIVNFLSNAELQEIKGLILSRCKSSVHGISRRKIKSENESNINIGALSGSIAGEILRENGKTDVFE